MIVFGTLLWIDEKNHSAVNNKNKKIESYFRQVDVLNKTLQDVFGATLHVFTNNPAPLVSWFGKRKKPAPVFVPIDSDMNIPEGTSFYTAHYKIEALKKGASLLEKEEDRFVLLDSDVIAVRPLDKEQTDLLKDNDLVIYDISDQVFPAYGKDKIKKDLEFILENSLENPKWFGGEFIAGSQTALLKLVTDVKAVLPRYFAGIKDFHHQGDEMFISAVLNRYLQKGEGRILIQNPHYFVSRHWSRYTKPSLSFHMRHNFIHCPGSKPALEMMSMTGAHRKMSVFLFLGLYQWLVVSYQLAKKLAGRQ